MGKGGTIINTGRYTFLRTVVQGLFQDFETYKGLYQSFIDQNRDKNGNIKDYDEEDALVKAIKDEWNEEDKMTDEKMDRIFEETPTENRSETFIKSYDVIKRFCTSARREPADFSRNREWLEGYIKKMASKSNLRDSFDMQNLKTFAIANAYLHHCDFVESMKGDNVGI